MAAEKAAALAAVEAEVEAEADDGAVVVELVTADGSEDIRVPPTGTWKARAQRHLNVGDFDSWAELVLPADEREKWTDLDPTNDDVVAFFERWKELGGQDAGKSRNSRRSSRGTPRR
jgi:hypothetical protein